MYSIAEDDNILPLTNPHCNRTCTSDRMELLREEEKPEDVLLDPTALEDDTLLVGLFEDFDSFSNSSSSGDESDSYRSVVRYDSFEGTETFRGIAVEDGDETSMYSGSISDEDSLRGAPSSEMNPLSVFTPRSSDSTCSDDLLEHVVSGGHFVTAPTTTTKNTRASTRSRTTTQDNKRKYSDDCEDEDYKPEPQTKRKTNTGTSSNGRTKKKHDPFKITKREEQTLSPAALKARKRELKKARNRQLAAESRARKKQKMELIEAENASLKKRVKELERELAVYRNETEDDLEKDEAPPAKRPRRSRNSKVVLQRGAGAMAATMSMIMFTDTTSGGAITADGASDTLAGFWLTSWSSVSLSGMLPHMFAIIFGTTLTLLFLSLYYVRTLHSKRRPLQFLPMNAGRVQFEFDDSEKNCICPKSPIPPFIIENTTAHCKACLPDVPISVSKRM